MSGWRSIGEVAPWFDRSPDAIRAMLEDPEHADFAARVRRRGTHRLFPASVTWHYACEGRMPESHEELAAFLEVFPVPESGRRRAQLVTEVAS